MSYRVLNPKGISIWSAVSAQLTIECPYTLQWIAPSPLKTAHSPGDLDRHLIYGSFGLPESSTQTASQSVQPFFCTAHRRTSLYLRMGCSFAPKLPLPMRICIPSNTWFPGPNWVHDPNDISIGSAVFTGLTTATDRPTDRSRYTV